ncbi:MAG: hypothetical protein ACI8XX_001977 [Polaribacter sp.]|jgi:hypothetical protein
MPMPGLQKQLVWRVDSLSRRLALNIMESNVAITGECFCGEIKYQVEGQLRDARSCHCSRCRKAFSAQASAYALVESNEFEWLSGKDLLTSYVGQHGFGLQFCRKCGSTLCGIYNDFIHGVTLGCVNGDPEIEIGKHIYVGSKAVWEVIPEGVNQYDENAPKIT